MVFKIYQRRRDSDKILTEPSQQSFILVRRNPTPAPHQGVSSRKNDLNLLEKVKPERLQITQLEQRLLEQEKKYGEANRRFESSKECKSKSKSNDKSPNKEKKAVRQPLPISRPSEPRLTESVSIDKPEKLEKLEKIDKLEKLEKVDDKL